MRTDFLRSAVATSLVLYLAAGPGFAVAAVPAIGVVITSGALRLNHATVRSNATLFEGAMIETGAAPARLDLTSGAQLELESESAGRVYGGHLALERGATRIGRTAGFGASFSLGSGAAFQVAVRGLTIQPDASGSTGRIVLIGDRRVEVSALTGSFRALNSQGMLIAKITPGRALALEPQSTPGPARLTGRLVSRGGHYLLTDETTNVTVEVAGSAITKSVLTRAVGQRVDVTGFARPGATPASGAAHLIEVAQLTPAPPSSGSAPAEPGGAGGTAPAGAGGSAGGSTGGSAGGAAAGAGGGAAGGAAVSVTLVAIIGGVAAAAVVGGLAATGSLGGSTAATVSR